VLLRLSYLALTNVFAFVRLLPVSDVDKDVEILALRHQLAVLQRQIDKPRLAPADRAFLGALLHRLPRPTLRQLHLIVSWAPSCAGTATSSATGTQRRPGRNGPAGRPLSAASRAWSFAWRRRTPTGATGASTANWPPSGSRSPRRLSGKSSGTPVSIPCPAATA